MADVRQMVTGFNHNVKHRGKAYHIQTEDSGVANPQITTHLFVGGNILATKKTSYADIVSAENLTQVVRELMEEQHKEMLRNLVNGVYDDRDQALSGQARAYQPGQLAGDPVAPPHAPALAARAPAAAAPAAPVPAAPATAAPVPTGARPPSAQTQPVPPAPAVPQVVFRPAVTPPPVLTRTAVPPRSPTARPTASAPRPTAPRPAAPATARRGADPADALFDDDLASEKSLDEVILSYLAEEPGPRK